MDVSDTDRQALAVAMRRLETPGFAGRITILIGRPAELAARAFPGRATGLIATAAEIALTRALDIALFSLRNPRLRGGRVVHSTLASASGAVGGAFGLSALTIELPVSTAIMLRAIAAIARSEGEDLADPATGLACLEVFGLGHSGPIAAEAAEGGYFAVRTLLARGVAQAADAVINKGSLHGGSAMALRALSPIVNRFGAIVSQKLAAQAMAVVGAVGGAAINLAFTEHFQDVAKGHFTVRRLERVYGSAAVRAEYERLKNLEPDQPLRITAIPNDHC
jgi:EcsC protein family